MIHSNFVFKIHTYDMPVIHTYVSYYDSYSMYLTKNHIYNHIYGIVTLAWRFHTNIHTNIHIHTMNHTVCFLLWCIPLISVRECIVNCRCLKTYGSVLKDGPLMPRKSNPKLLLKMSVFQGVETSLGGIRFQRKTSNRSS